mgnify:CR=1 FL=1
MVRLQHVGADVGDALSRAFQSHYGAIATIAGFPQQTLSYAFNPTMVRLQLVVSAPPQDDADLAFNPTMVRLQPR